MVDTVVGPLTGRILNAKSGEEVTPVKGKKAPTKKAPVQKPVAEKAEPKAAAPKAEKAKAAEKAPKEIKGGNKKITLVAKACPSRAGSVRAKRWAKLETGMTLSEASEAGIPQSYLKRMAKAGHLKIG